MVKGNFRGAVTAEQIANMVGEGEGVLLGRPTEEVGVIAEHIRRAKETGRIDLTSAAIEANVASKQKGGAGGRKPEDMPEQVRNDPEVTVDYDHTVAAERSGYNMS